MDCLFSTDERGWYVILLVVAHPTLRLDRKLGTMWSDRERKRILSLLRERDRLMARKECRSPATAEQVLTCLRTQCGFCSQLIWVAYHTWRTITMLQGNCRLTLSVRRCHNLQCEWYLRPYLPEEEGRWALPHGEFGLDVIALVGTLRYTSHRSVPEIYQTLRDRGIQIAERTVTHLLQRCEELVALHLSDQRRLHERFKEQRQVLLAIDGLQPDVGHEVLWILRDCLSGEVLLARSLLSSREADLANLLREVQQMLDQLLRACIPLAGQSFASLIQHDGVPCGVNSTIAMRHGVCSIASANLLSVIWQILRKSSSRKNYRRRF